MFMNGVLGGLAGITAGADQMLPGSAIVIGLIAGVIVVPVSYTHLALPTKRIV